MSAYEFPKLSTTNEDQERAVKKLIVRLIGHEKSVLFQININITASKDLFILEKRDNIIHVSSTSGVGAAYGIHFYLKTFCNCHISWDTDQLQLPYDLPFVNFTGRSFDQFRYYQNVCAYSYSYVWWSWDRWEREIDWMALNGINIALAQTAQEEIWRRVYQKFNLTQSEINKHFAGPAFLAWSRLGNIRGWSGPLFQNWNKKSVWLQHKILRRMKSLGITPILPTFCGQIPRAFRRIFPSVRMKLLEKWSNFPSEFCCPYLLDPAEPLFTDIGKMFMEELKAEFGTTHFYNCDIFNEMRPPYKNSNYLKKITSTVYNIISTSDPTAVWILQGWQFAYDPHFWSKERVQFFLSGVPDDKMIILDLQSETQPMYVLLSSYFGKPFIWCMLHNFGGTLGMHGSLSVLNTRILEARSMKKSSMIGTGLTPEGINQNYVVYDFMTECAWRNVSVDLDAWIEKYAERRYGNNNNLLKSAWKILKNSVYNYLLTKPLHGRYTFILRPSTQHEALIWYNVSDILIAWDFMMNISDDKLSKNSNYLHDLLDISRQVFQVLFDVFYKKMINDYFRVNLLSFSKHSQLLLDLLTDLDLALSTNSRFMLGPWLQEAKAKGKTMQEKRSLELNARNQITLWGPTGEIVDYAAKQWAGLIEDYYYKRWQLFIKYLNKSLQSRTPFNEKMFKRDVFNSVEKPFSYSRKNYPCVPRNDTKFIIKILYVKWRSAFIP